MLKRSPSFMGKNKIIYEHQFGFQKNRSTTLAVLICIPKLSLNVSKSNMTLFKKNRTKTSKKLSVKIMGEEIKEKEYAKYLGILIYNKMS